MSTIRERKLIFYLCLLGLLTGALGVGCAYYYRAASKAEVIKQAALNELNAKYEGIIKDLNKEREKIVKDQEAKHKLDLAAGKKEAAAEVTAKAQEKITLAYNEINRLKEILAKKREYLGYTTEEMVRARQELQSLKTSTRQVAVLKSQSKKRVAK